MNEIIESGNAPQGLEPETLFTSDTHFGHRNIIKYSDRPFKDVAHMNEMLIHNWNSIVRAQDHVFHLGDVALGPWTEWDAILMRLAGRLHLIIGNHDRVFEEMPERQQARFRQMYAKWFPERVTNAHTIVLSNGMEVNLSHFPYDGDSHDADRFVGARIKDNGRVLIHGHTHLDQKVSRSKKGTLQIHVGQDAWNYRPVRESEVIALIEENL